MRSLIRPRRRLKADPAPSRWSWRIERWLMTPGIRLMLRAGLPLALMIGAGAWYLSDETRRVEIADMVAEARTSIEQRPEFRVNLMSVTGASDDVAAEIRDIMPVEFPISSFDLDLDAIRAAIAALDPVKDVSIRIRPGGVLEAHVTERVPVAVWRSYDRVTLVDNEGAHVAEVRSRLIRPDLPLIAGDGANTRVPEALTLIRAAQPLGERLRGLVRIGERRWDLVLDRDQRILLPERGARQALDRVLALDKAQEILARDIARVDMRLLARPTIQMNPDATSEWWRIRSLEAPVD